MPINKHKKSDALILANSLLSSIKQRKTIQQAPGQSTCLNTLVGYEDSTGPKYCAYTILPKEKTGGLYILRKLIVGAGKIERIEDDVEDLFSIKAAKLADILHGIMG